MEDLGVILSSADRLSVKVHPVVIFNVLDHFIRRNQEQDRVIGALLGVNVEGVVEFKNSFPVPHSEGDAVAVDMEFHKSMFDLHQRTAPKEIIVGWYSTGLDINENSVLIHEFFSKEVTSEKGPIHLLVDTQLTNDTLGMRSYIGTPVGFADKNLGAYYQPLPMEVMTMDVDRVGFEAFSRTKHDPSGLTTLLADVDNVESTISKLLDMLNDVSTYVDAAASGSGPADPIVGRLLGKSISALPTVDPETLDRVFNNNIQDLLMTVYLSNLTKTQIAIAQKLQQAIP